MSPAVIYSTIALLAGGLFALGKKLRAGPWGRQKWMLRSPWLMMLALPWFLGMAYYAHLFDQPWYYEWRAWRGTDFMMALFAIPLSLVFPPWKGQGRPRKALLQALLEFLLAVMVVMAVFAKPLLFPLPIDPQAARWHDGVCIQSTRASCGPCAVATVLRTLGLNLEEAQLANEAQTSQTGTLNWLLLRALRARGLTAVIAKSDDLAEVEAPAVVGVTLANSGAGHFVAYLGRTNGKLVIGDPLEGRLVLDQGEFQRRYTFGRFALRISR
jgi:hypothetical protein